MAILLGIDTGGTYTDAVLLDDSAKGTGVLAKAKALTTRRDLSEGIGAAIDAVMAETAGLSPADISLVSLSTTLATNALVERQGGRVCLILIGFDPNVLDRAGLGDALSGDPVISVSGGHTASGDRAADLDLDAVLEGVIRTSETVGAFAVVAHFGVRNAEDERAVKTLIEEKTALPVTCGHELASDLNGPKRAVTSVLNARLIGVISDLIDATEQTIAARNITAPLMMVRGDGSLVSAGFAGSRPIETILSGPAASLVGAAHLTGCSDAVISDVGGTTTDIAILRNGIPALAATGASVGGFQTMVEAVDMVTHGLGGDSEVHIVTSGTQARLSLGPRRVIPVSLAACQHGDAIRSALEAQTSTPIPHEHDARFVIRGMDVSETRSLSDRERAVLERTSEVPRSMKEVISTRADISALRALITMGWVRQIGFTPTDAAHVLGECADWDAEAAETAAILMARQRDGSGQSVRPDAGSFCQWAIETLIETSSHHVLNAALSHDQLPTVDPNTNPIASAGLARHSGASTIKLGLGLPLVGLGASASVYYPEIGRRLSVNAIVPKDADVANAVGAVAGQVRLSREALVTCPADGLFRAHLSKGNQEFSDLDAAKDALLRDLSKIVREEAQFAGASEIALTSAWSERTAEVEGKRIVIEIKLRITATGRPKIGSWLPQATSSTGSLRT